MVKIVLEPQFASSQENYRQNIRKHIIENYSLTSEEQSQILNLNQLPQPKNFYVSIAHCKSMGGYTVSSEPVGFDLEELERISVDAVKRISPADIKPQDIRWLWPTKEAMVKLTSAAVISDCHVISWEGNNFNGLYKNQEIYGSIQLKDQYIWATCFFKLGIKFDPQ